MAKHGGRCEGYGPNSRPTPSKEPGCFGVVVIMFCGLGGLVALLANMAHMVA